MAFNPDDFIEKWIIRLLPFWGPFYALFYLMRLFWKEVIRRKED